MRKSAALLAAALLYLDQYQNGLLAAEVAHEIRNPLTVMKMMYHSLDLKFPAGDPRAKVLCAHAS